MQVYRLTGNAAFERDWALRDQLRRSAVSVPSNVAEGAERTGGREVAQFFTIARGSLAEMQTQLEIAVEVGILTQEQIESKIAESDELMKMLRALATNLRRED